MKKILTILLSLICISVYGQIKVDQVDTASANALVSKSRLATNLGAYVTTVSGNSTYLKKANNLSDIASTSAARSTLGVAYGIPYQIRNNFMVAWWGDSLTGGAQDLGSMGAPTQLQNLTGWNVYNGGISSQTSTQILARFNTDTLRQHYATIIWAGRNDLGDTTTFKTNMSAFKTTMASIGNARYVVLGVIKQRLSTEYTGATNSTTINRMNSFLSTTFGSHYVDINALLVASYNPAIPQDVIDNGHGVPPFSKHALNDSLHLNQVGYLFVDQQIPLTQLQDTTVILTNKIARGIMQNVDHMDVSLAGNYKIGGNTVAMLPDQSTYTGTVYIGTTNNILANRQVGSQLTHSSGSDGQWNYFSGYLSGENATTANSNTGGGAFNLYQLTTGSSNTSFGYQALKDVTQAVGVTALGQLAGGGITTGTHDLILGDGLNGLASNLANKIILGVNAVQSINISGGSTPAANLVLRTGNSGGAADFTAITAADLPAGVPTSAANPTASTGLTAVNGSATTFMRSDAAPPISQTIIPTWTGLHIFQGGINTSGNITAAQWLTGGINFKTVAATYTDNSSSGTVAFNAINSFGIPTLVASSATTYTTAATVYIAGAPVASTNVTSANNYSLYVASGNSFVGNLFTGGLVSIGVGATSTALQSNSTLANSDFASIGSGSATSTAAGLLFGGASTVNYRTFMNGQTSTVLGTGNSYANFIVGSAPINTFTSGTHAWLANQVVNKLGTVTSGGATVTNSASFMAYGQSTAGTNKYTGFFYDDAGVGTNNTWFKYGITRVSALQSDTLTASKAVFTDANKQLTSTGFGTSAQFIMGDGSLNSNTYALSSTSAIHGNSTTTGTATSAVTVTIGSTMANNTYFVTITPQDLLTAVNYYVSAKTTTTFTITFVSALTGSINFDWNINP